MAGTPKIGIPSQQCKIAAGLFWADYAVLGAQVKELEAAGVDWIHIEVRDGKHMDYGMPRGGFDIIEYESRAPFWVKLQAGKSPHTIDPIMVKTMRRLYAIIAEAGMERQIELMEDGRLNAGNVAEFIPAGMTVGELSSPLLKGPGGKLKPGTGEVAAAVQKLRTVMESASLSNRTPEGALRD